MLIIDLWRREQHCPVLLKKANLGSVHQCLVALAAAGLSVQRVVPCNAMQAGMHWLIDVSMSFRSSNTLTGRTGRLHIFQTLVPSYRAQVFISGMSFLPREPGSVCV